MPSVYHLLARQIPAHIQQAHPVFCKFIEYYYRWLQTRGFVSLSDLKTLIVLQIQSPLKIAQLIQ